MNLLKETRDSKPCVVNQSQFLTDFVILLRTNYQHLALNQQKPSLSSMVTYGVEISQQKLFFVDKMKILFSN